MTIQNATKNDEPNKKMTQAGEAKFVKCYLRWPGKRANDTKPLHSKKIAGEKQKRLNRSSNFSQAIKYL